jgi:hypothetical protein
LGLLDAEVDDARDVSWIGSFIMWLYLAAKPSHVGINVDGLARPLYCPTVRSYQTRGYDLPPGVVLSCRYSRLRRFSGDVQLPGLGYLVES